MLEVKGISKHYKNKQILNGISFAAGPGQCVGIAGGNGCGKTTLLSILAGVNRPDRGSICFDGVEAVGNRKVFERNAAYVPKENPLIPELTARDNYRLWFKGDKAELERDLEEGVGKFLGLTEFLGTPAGKLSGGQKRRVAIAGVLAMRPEMMILDEPTAGLDPQGRDEILDQIERLNRRYGLTILLVSHSMEDVARYVDRIMVMNHGEKVFDDTPKEVFKHYKELEDMGLAAPQITYVVQELREHGIPVDDTITTVEEARDAILNLLREKGRLTL